MTDDILAAIASRVKLNALASLNRSASLVEAAAKEHAPVRNIFEGDDRRIRFKTRAEVVADRALRRRLGLAPELIAQPRTRLRSRRGMGKAKIATRSPRNDTVFRIRGANGLAVAAAALELTRRGRYEVSSGRADHNGFVGGRLRDEIQALPATGEGSHFEARVISPTPYAKYQEFGTRHNAAHPYLRPALHESRTQIVADMRSAIRGAVRGAKPVVTVAEE